LTASQAASPLYHHRFDNAIVPQLQEAAATVLHWNKPMIGVQKLQASPGQKLSSTNQKVSGWSFPKQIVLQGEQVASVMAWPSSAP
jgi:hypothetical protein